VARWSAPPRGQTPGVVIMSKAHLIVSQVDRKMEDEGRKYIFFVLESAPPELSIFQSMFSLFSRTNSAFRFRGGEGFRQVLTGCEPQIFTFLRYNFRTWARSCLRKYCKARSFLFFFYFFLISGYNSFFWNAKLAMVSFQYLFIEVTA